MRKRKRPVHGACSKNQSVFFSNSLFEKLFLNVCFSIILLLYAIYNSVSEDRWPVVDLAVGCLTVYKLCIWANFGRIGAVLVSGFVTIGASWILAKRDLARAESAMMRARVSFADPVDDNGRNAPMAVAIPDGRPVRRVERAARKCRIPYQPRK